MINVTVESDPCIEGYICGMNTTSSSKFDMPCPAGFWCDEETKPSHLDCAAGVIVQDARADAEVVIGQGTPLAACPCLDTCGSGHRDDGRICYCPVGLCPAGFICNEGTRATRRRQTPCTAGYYCPEGTAPEMLEEQRCPEGTFSPAQSTTIMQCARIGSSVTTAISVTLFTENEQDLRTRLSRYIVDDPELTCRTFEEPCVSNLAVNTRRALKAKGVSGTNLSSATFRRRQMQAESENGGNLYDGLYLTPPPDQITFRLPAFMMARLEFDFTSIPPPMMYDDHWRIAIFVDGHKHSTPYPTSFWFDPPVSRPRDLYPEYAPYRFSKSTQMALHLHGMRDVLFRVELQILHGLYTDQIALFRNTMNMNILPESGVFRANPNLIGADGFGERLGFLTLLAKEDRFALALNMPRLLPNDKHYPSVYEPWKMDFGGAILEYSRVNMSSSVLIDPIDGALSVSFKDEDYWTSSLIYAPMSYFPYFSKCTGGVRIGLPPSGQAGSRNYANDEGTPFAIGYADANGGSPSRRRGDRMMCNCGGQVRFEQGDCGSCVTVTDVYSGEPGRAIDFRTVDLSGLPPGSDKYHFLPTDDLPGDPAVPAFVVHTNCRSCDVAPGDPYPYLHQSIGGRTLRISGWDGHGVVFNVLEHPQACNIVPLDQTFGIGEWNWLATRRYSDACDYIMQCMYEENTLLAQNKPFWFEPVDLDILFWITRNPTDVQTVATGFAFPDLQAGQNIDLRRELEGRYGKLKYFSTVRDLKRNEDFMFVRAETAGALDGGKAGWYPLRLQLHLEYAIDDFTHAVLI